MKLTLIHRFSATLYYIVKGRGKNKYGTPFKNHIIRTLLNGMSAHITDEVSLIFWREKKTVFEFLNRFISDYDAKRLFDSLSILDSERCRKYLIPDKPLRSYSDNIFL